MGKNKNKKKLVGPWRNVHGAIWLIGLATLALKGWWWPGILVLVALSMLLEAALMQFVPHAFKEEEEDKDKTPMAPAAPPTAQTPADPAAAEHRTDLLPSTCPKCGAPVRGNEVRWTGSRSAECSFCGANLPMMPS